MIVSPGGKLATLHCPATAASWSAVNLAKIGCCARICAMSSSDGGAGAGSLRPGIIAILVCAAELPAAHIAQFLAGFPDAAVEPAHLQLAQPVAQVAAAFAPPLHRHDAGDARAGLGHGGRGLDRGRPADQGGNGDAGTSNRTHWDSSPVRYATSGATLPTTPDARLYSWSRAGRGGFPLRPAGTAAIPRRP